MKSTFATLICVLLGLGTAHAQAIDPSFNPGISPAGGDVFALALQADGKLLVAGNFGGLGGGTGTTSRRNIGRFNADGSLDTGFNPGTNGPIYTIAVQPDGKILIGGLFFGVGGGTGTTPRSLIARLNEDGSVDAGFNPGANSIVRSIVLQPDGRILVGGLFSTIAGASRQRIARLNANGTVDSGFDPGVLGNYVQAIALQPDGQIVVGGDFTHLGGGTGVTPRMSIGRLSTDGNVDMSFDPGVSTPSGNPGTVYALALQPDGKILLAGSFLGVGGGAGVTPRAHIARLLISGLVDTFDPGADGPVLTLALQTDGRVLAGGVFGFLGGGTGNTPREAIGRFNTDGSLDAFNPGANNDIEAILIQPDGKVLVGGPFTGLGAGSGSQVTRIGLGRIFNSDPATQSVAVTGSPITAITWMRGGTSPEVSRVEFAWSTDGMTFTDLGAGDRIAGGWQVTGLGLPADPNLRIRARAFYSAGFLDAASSIIETIAPASGIDIVENGDFVGGTTNWQLFATPDISYIQSNVTGGVFQFYRVAPPPGTTNQAVAFQQTGLPMPAMAPIEAQFQLGNTDTVRKRITVLLHDISFGDLAVCTFWLPANAPLTTYMMRTHTTQAWADTTISFYAASVNASGNTTGFYQIDNVSVKYMPAGVADATECVDPLTPAPPGGAAGANLLTNGDFNTGALAPWATFGQIQQQITGGVFEFIKLAGAPAGVVLQSTGQAVTANQILTATFQLGNSSPVRKRVTVILHDSNFSDLSACTFWLSPGQPLSTYTFRTFATQAWSNATLSVYPATVGADQWILLDDVTLQRTPAAPLTGTHCIEPGAAVPLTPIGAGGHGRVLASASSYADRRTATERAARETRIAAVVVDGFVASETVGSNGATGVDTGLRTLSLEPVDLTSATSARLTLHSWVTSVGSRARIEVSRDGATWETVQEITISDFWLRLDVNLDAYRGEVIHIRFVFDPVAL